MSLFDEIDISLNKPGTQVVPATPVVEAPMRSSLEVLQRMANGLDPFDHNRFKAAVAALQYETPKLSQSHNLSVVGYGDAGGFAARLEKARLRVISHRNGDGPSPPDSTEPTATD
jgi:hypothetical protein